MSITSKVTDLLKVSYPTKFIDENIPIFSARSEDERKSDKYDSDFATVDRYTGMYAFGHMLLGAGGTQGLYCTINYLLLSNIGLNTESIILDIGCGVGRTIYDCADLLPKSTFIGMDYAYNMCKRAKEILIDGKDILLTELAYTGFGESIEFKNTKKLKNVTIVQGSAIDLPFKPNSVDCVINTYLIDRLNNPEKAIEQMVSVLKPGGLFILSDPLNFDKAETRKKLPNKDKLIELIANQGIELKEVFDGLIYREVSDIRGNYKDWLSLVCHGRKSC